MTTIAEKLTAISEAKEAIKVAIADKGVDMEGVAFPQYAEKIAEIPTGGGGGGGESAPQYTGHADVEGLKAIGWTDEDIAYYQQYGVNWNEEDDDLHKVPADNIALYGVLTISNISSYKDKLVYLPKINVGSGKQSLCSNCSLLVAIPMLDLSQVSSLRYAFNECSALVCLPPLDMSNVVDMTSMCNLCRNLVNVPPLDLSSVTNLSSAFNYCYNLTNSRINGIKTGIDLSYLWRLNKESLLYIINNEAATSRITIKLYSNVYTNLANDEDIVAALANHPNISLSK